jgi:nucleoside-diphosphate-sugar epimerase
MGSKEAAMRILVTGGGGFLGFAIVQMLNARGDDVVVLCRGHYPSLDALQVKTVRGDVADLSAVQKASQGCQAIIHCAAMAGMWGAYEAYHLVNVVGTENVIAACRYHNIPKLVFTSSPSVAYGREGSEGGDESLPYPPSYESHYSATKAHAERAVLAANDQHLSTCALRPHLIWGPNDNQLVPRITDRARRGRLRIVGDGLNLVDSIYVDNAAEAHLLALDRLEPGAACAGKAYFLSQDEPLPISDLVNRILDAAGLPACNKYLSLRTAHRLGAVFETVYSFLGIRSEPVMTRFLAYQLATPHWFDISAAKRDLGYQAKIGIDDGMNRLRDYLTVNSQG